MRLMARIFLGLGVFMIVAGVIYGLHSYEWQGFALMLTVAGGALIIGGFIAQGVQRAQTAAADREQVEMEGEPHVGPTIWPLVFSLSMIGLVVGAVASRWVLAIGGALCIVALAGWLSDVHRQWQHHYHAETHTDGSDGHGAHQAKG